MKDIDLRSGIRIPIETFADDKVFHEIFLYKVYETAIKQTIKRSVVNPLSILDLGCNVGFFSFYAADCLTEQHLHNFEIIGIDGSNRVLETFVNRINIQPVVRLDTRIKLTQGLVGKKEGVNTFMDVDFSPMNKIGEGPEVPYINLDLCAPKGCDLIKCDIEGAEGEFINNYKELLQKSRVLVIEFHEVEVDVEGLREKLHSYNFSGVERIQQGNVSVETFINTQGK